MGVEDVILSTLAWPELIIEIQHNKNRALILKKRFFSRFNLLLETHCILNAFYFPVFIPELFSQNRICFF